MTAQPLCGETGTGLFDRPLSCVFEPGHDGVWHQDPGGAQWRDTNPRQATAAGREDKA